MGKITLVSQIALQIITTPICEKQSLAMVLLVRRCRS